MLAPWLNAAWRWKCAGEASRFRRATTDVAQTQRDLLLSILAANRDTAFGRQHGFAAIRTVSDFQRQVPISTYDDIEPHISRIAAGEPNVLTAERVLLLQPTSGSTSSEKLIPYTHSLRRQFQCGVAAWIADLFARRPSVCQGRAYWSISPSLGPRRRTAGGIPIGFDDDAAYLGRLEQWALRHLLAVPGEVAQLPDIDSVRYATLLFLLAADNLSLISVWNPTFLTSLLAPLPQWSDRLVSDLRQGRCSPPEPIPPGAAKNLSRWLRPLPKRADEVASLLRDANGDVPCEALWPRLALISCWTDAGASYFLPALSRLFPHTEIQPKGLLATEGFVSLPLVAHEGAALAVRSHFFEFAELGDSSRCSLAHEIERGGRYRVLLTTGGGLYRYDLGDEVEVVGFVGQCPTLRFCGKLTRTSDLVGEKLSEAHVQESLDAVTRSLNVQPTFVLLAPFLDSPPHYRLYVQGVADDALPLLENQLQKRLEENPYYRHAIAFEQLAPLEVVLLEPSVPAWSLYEHHCLARGQRAGDIKPAVLDRWTGWPDVFAEAATGGRESFRADDYLSPEMIGPKRLPTPSS
jgi:hypothetical protein